MWCSVVRTGRRGGPSQRQTLVTLFGEHSLSLSLSRSRFPHLILRFLTAPDYKTSHRRQHTMWALVSLRLLAPLLLVLSTPTTNAAVIPFTNNGGGGGGSPSSQGMMCRPRLSGLVQQIRKSGDRESSWRELSGRELITNQTASRTAARSYSPSSVEIGCHKTVSLRNNDRWRTSSRSGPEGGAAFSHPPRCD